MVLRAHRTGFAIPSYVFTYRFIGCRHLKGVDGSVIALPLFSSFVLPLFYHCSARFAASLLLLCFSFYYGTTWHTPTAADFAELYGSAAENGNPYGAKRLGPFVAGSFTPLSGAAFGPNHNDVTLTADNRVINADPYINGVVFLPASGYRLKDNGSTYFIGLTGQYYSSTASTPGSGYFLGFNSTNIAPQQNSYRSHGISVRCIRD